MFHPDSVSTEPKCVLFLTLTPEAAFVPRPNQTVSTVFVPLWNWILRWRNRVAVCCSSPRLWLRISRCRAVHPKLLQGRVSKNTILSSSISFFNIKSSPLHTQTYTHAHLWLYNWNRLFLICLVVWFGFSNSLREARRLHVVASDFLFQRVETQILYLETVVIFCVILLWNLRYVLLKGLVWMCLTA